LPETVLNSQLIDGSYPDVRRIIPTAFTTRIVLGREEMLQACKRASIFAREVSNIVTLAVHTGEIVVSADSAESGQGSTSLGASVEGNELDIAFNVRFLIDVLSALAAPQISLELNAPTNPGVIKPIGDDTFIHVVMPMHLGRR